MAERRMFAKTIIDSDLFLDMPATAQLLYFHLGMRADDDGFINNPKRIMRDIRCSDDDLKMLIAKKYIIPFESGVIVIRHWKIHNFIRGDRYKKTACEELKSLKLNDNKVYEFMDTTGIPSDIPMVDTGKVRLGKDSIGKDSIELGKTTTTTSVEVNTDNHVDVVVDEAWDKIVRLYEDCIHPIPNMVEGEDLTDMYHEFGAEWLLEAIKEAARQRARSIKYISAILNNWSKKGSKEPWNEKKQETIPQMDIASKALAMLEDMESDNG